MVFDAGERTTAGKAAAQAHAVHVETRARVEFKDITSVIQKLVAESGVQNGTCFVFVPHTTAAVLINENADPGLRTDLDNFLRQLAPRDKNYYHDDGNCDAHLKAAVLGCSKSLLVENGRLVLGTWQGVYLCEFDGPRRREVRVKIVRD
jgi:secondary thiamine-phosphate synthase enzyme